MIAKKLDDIGIADIEELISTQVREGKTIEYKKLLSIGSDSEKKEFLADVSSFANTGDGDLILGVEAIDGVPTALFPLSIENIDAETLRIESVIRSGISPRFSFALHPIPTANPSEYVLLLRVQESWNKPHRITFSGSGKFFARSSVGKYELDVEELRQVFTLSDGIEKRISDFRAERLIEIQTGGTMLPFRSNNLIVVHLLPLSSFSNKSALRRDTLLALERETNLFKPMCTSQWHAPHINLEGVFSYSGEEGSDMHSSVQLFRSGAIEVVESYILDRGDGGLIPYILYEMEIIKSVQNALEILRKVEIGTPVLVGLSLLNVKGMKMSDGNQERIFNHEHAIRQRDLILPTVVFDDYAQNVATTLKPAFDLVWNACGIPGSKNYDAAGVFTAQ